MNAKVTLYTVDGKNVCFHAEGETLSQVRDHVLHTIRTEDSITIDSPHQSTLTLTNRITNAAVDPA